MNPSPNSIPHEPTELDRRLDACAPGAYPWDDWQREALAAGLSPDLAALGRAVMREAYQHDWCDRLKYKTCKKPGNFNLLEKFPADTPVTMMFRKALFSSGHDLQDFADKLGIELGLNEVEQ